jgi:FkbM family methyltransferase
VPQSFARALLVPAYGRALRLLYSRTGLPWKVHDQVIRIDPQARHLVPHGGEPALFDFLAHTIRPGDIVLDVGAFLGIYAVLAARWSGPGGRVVAFEPTPSSAALARRHLAYNGLGPNRVSLIEAAVSDRAARATLHQYDDSAMPYVNSLVAAVDTDAPAVTQPVDVVTIDEVCHEWEIVPSVIRMDVQGAEIHALRGARATIRGASRLSLVIEMHPQCWPAFGVTADDAHATLAELGLTARPLVAGEAVFARDTHAVLSLDSSRGSAA